MVPVSCERCGAPRVPGGSFCPSCGSPQTGSPGPSGALLPQTWAQPPGLTGGPPRARAVPNDTIVVVVVLCVVVIMILLSVGSYFLVANLAPSRSGSTPLGMAFEAGNPFPTTCPTGSSFLVTGCASGHFRYALEVESSVVTLGDLFFNVSTKTGNVAQEPGALGFSILNLSQVVLAQYSVNAGKLTMISASWTYSSSTTSSTLLSITDSIEIDMGTVDPVGLGLTFVAIGAGPYTGTTAPLSLP